MRSGIIVELSAQKKNPFGIFFCGEFVIVKWRALVEFSVLDCSFVAQIKSKNLFEMLNLNSKKSALQRNQLMFQ